MRVVHLCVADDGAAYRLHRGLQQAGVESTMLVAQKLTEDPAVAAFRPPRAFAARLRRRLPARIYAAEPRIARRHRPARYGAFFDDRSPHRADVLAQVPSPEILHVHTFTRLMDVRAFFAGLPAGVPVVQTLHDMSAFTGGCLYTWDCEKFATRCGTCPQLGGRGERDLSRRIWGRKHSALARLETGRLQLVTPSWWLADQARRSSLLGRFPLTVIPHGVDTEIFCPRDRALARSVLQLPAEAPIVLFVAEPLNRAEKGFGLLVRAFDRLDDPRALLLSAGSGPLPATVRDRHRHLGRVHDERLLSLVYSAADVLAVPSLQDNLPQTVLEATACGTPAVGFAVGGIAEEILDGETGLLVPAGDVEALTGALSALLRDPGRRAAMAARCRRLALAEYALHVSARRHEALYRRLLEAAPAAAGMVSPT